MPSQMLPASEQYDSSQDLTSNTGLPGKNIMLVGLGVFSTWMKSDRLEPMGKEGSQELNLSRTNPVRRMGGRGTSDRHNAATFPKP